MLRHGWRIAIAGPVAVVAFACSSDSTSSTPGPNYDRVKLIITSPADTVLVRRYGFCTVFDTALVTGIPNQVAETLRVNRGVAATIVASFESPFGQADVLAHSGAYSLVVNGLRSKVGTLTWAQTGDFSGTLVGSAVTNPPASNDSASIRIGLVNKTTGDTIYGATCPVRVTVR